MKRFLVLLMFAMLVPTTTGCKHKKRVKTLETELAACRAKKASLQGADAAEPSTTFVATAATPEEE